jgi:hypothetical protein
MLDRNHGPGRHFPHRRSRVRKSSAMSPTQLAERPGQTKIKWERKIRDHQRRLLWARQAFLELRPANDLPHPTAQAAFRPGHPESDIQ